MDDPSIQVPLPFAVEQLIDKICVMHLSPPPKPHVRRRLSSIGEQPSVHILEKVASVSTRIDCVDAYIMSMVKKYGITPNAESISLSPHKPSSSCSSSPTPSDASLNSPVACQFIRSPCSTPKGILLGNITPQSFNSNSPTLRHLVSQSTGSEMARKSSISQQSLILAELEFRKFFLVLSYIGRNKLEDAVTVDDANFIVGKTREQVESMMDFELRMWRHFGCKYCQESNRAMHLDWDSGKTHLYYCYVCADGSYYFEGPSLKGTRTHLQRVVGDDNVLIVKFGQDTNIGNNSSNRNTTYEKIVREGILVGLRQYRFFVFKDGGKVEKTKGKEKMGTPKSWDVKCYFIRRESLAPCDERDPYILSQTTVHEARCLFMHVHMVSSLVKYMARFSLILSQTIKLPVDLRSVVVEHIPDIYCHDENGCVVIDEDGQPLIHTDGTGFISEELALMCPENFCDAKYLKDGNLESFLAQCNLEEKSFGQRGREACVREPPLLIQCRLYHEGRAVKGTLLLNRKLEGRMIQIRPSMVKVEKDVRLSDIESFESLEVNAVSHKPKKARLSKNLILLLSVGGVPQDYFLGLLESTLEDSQSVYSNKRAALRVSLNNGEIDDYFTSTRMILAGVPLNEPCLQYRLSILAREERKGLGEGKLPISESFYLMGTADPTGVLKSNQVCIISENGQMSGKVLVYRNPGLHFGDVHILDAVYVEALEDFVGNAKYAIFFSTEGQRSVASEIANGDFDGDLYWVSRNPQLLTYFKASDPWKRLHSTPSACSRNPMDFSDDELEHELVKLLFDAKKQSNVAGMAANSWSALMDRLLILGDGSASETDAIQEKILKLIDIYYDALDASKTGKKVEVSNYLMTDKNPHYMERGNLYHSTSVLGRIYDRAKEFKTEKLEIEEIWKLPCLSRRNIPDDCMNKWRERYAQYRREMTGAMKCGGESKNDSTNNVIKKYKQMLYGAVEFEESTRNINDIYNDALALYHVTYDFAMKRNDVGKCYFAWRVAGSALCKYYSSNQGERLITCLPSVLKEVLK